LKGVTLSRRILLAATIVVGVALVMVLLLSRNRDDANQANLAWGPLAVVPRQDGQMQALTSGRLRITDTCVYLEEGGDEARKVTLVWSQSWTTWIPDRSEIGFNNRGRGFLTLRDGQILGFGGGGDSIDEGGLPGPIWLARTSWVSPPNPSCPIDTRWYVNEVVDVG
jgi:hypothetical protein